MKKIIHKEIVSNYQTTCPKCKSPLKLSKGEYLTVVAIKHATCNKCKTLWDVYEDGRIDVCNLPT